MDMAVEERAMGRTGLDGGRDRGLWEPSLSLPWLLGGVGGICTRSSGESRGNQVSRVVPQLCWALRVQQSMGPSQPDVMVENAGALTSCNIRSPSVVSERPELTSQKLIPGCSPPHCLL